MQATFLPAREIHRKDETDIDIDSSSCGLLSIVSFHLIDTRNDANIQLFVSNSRNEENQWAAWKSTFDLVYTQYSNDLRHDSSQFTCKYTSTDSLIISLFSMANLID